MELIGPFVAYLASCLVSISSCYVRICCQNDTCLPLNHIFFSVKRQKYIFKKCILFPKNLFLLNHQIETFVVKIINSSCESQFSKKIVSDFQLKKNKKLLILKSYHIQNKIHKIETNRKYLFLIKFFVMKVKLQILHLFVLKVDFL